MALSSPLYRTQTTCKHINCATRLRSQYPSRRAQYAVLTKHLGVTKLHCVVGFSMGGQQVFMNAPLKSSKSLVFSLRHTIGPCYFRTSLSAS